jgi:hypothetical protein
MKNQDSKPIDCSWVVLFHREITVVKINAKLITHYHELILGCLRYESKEIFIYLALSMGLFFVVPSWWSSSSFCCFYIVYWQRVKDLLATGFCFSLHNTFITIYLLLCYENEWKEGFKSNLKTKQGKCISLFFLLTFSV